MTRESSYGKKISRRTAIKTIGVAAGATAAATSAPFIIRRATAADPIKVGVISPLTGAWTVYGKAHISGFQLGVDEVNANGGVLGRKLEIVVGDSKTEPRIVVEQANRLIRQERVDFLAGTFSSAERNAAGPVVTGANKILLYPTFYEGQEKEYYPGVCNKNIFMFGPEPTQQVWPHLEYMMGKFGKKFFMIGSDYAWPRVTNLVTKRKLTELGGEIVGEVYIPFNTPQYESVLREIRGSGADIVFHSLTGSDTVNFRRQYAAAGMKDDFLLWTVDDEEVVTSGLGPDVSSGDYVSFDYFMSIVHPNNKAFLDRFKAKFGQDALMNTVGVAMYNAAHMAAKAIEKTGEVSTDALREGLRGMTFDGAPQGSARMRAIDHQMVVPSYLMRVREGWTSVNDMFEEIQSFESVEPLDARCDLPL
ncbi:MAG: ABC transporter substrate-binding protein [Gammaproteobacteria bacterium]|nr:ABC transporter substrate-binding protein [Gammaproteobacteria bacterium]NIR84116.1 ABC transporter substrate-binding protein [Gammaproteobacteria bacterium]NIR89414.1 ABC transporter substrate-binding protein [Gammaproteobacteria bacterium]NIU07135.1 ABC transporter substrate-binding protein [Gammaproteobacteria bacterium]NIV74639.1 ABC transporter substrate-binding protein [Gammaproteobacteria bacterium]